MENALANFQLQIYEKNRSKQLRSTRVKNVIKSVAQIFFFTLHFKIQSDFQVFENVDRVKETQLHVCKHLILYLTRG